MTLSDKAKQWVEENTKAFECWNRHVEEHGLPLSQFNQLGREQEHDAGQQWAEDNREAIESSNDYVEEHVRKDSNELIDVVNVTATADFKLLLEFENGERRVFDMAPLMDKKPFVRLRDPVKFTQAYVDYGTVVWPGNIDIAPETLYDRSKTLRT